MSRHGVRHLVLASRRGNAGGDAAALLTELAAGGAAVTAVACDVADRSAVAEMLAAIGPRHPLTAVVHAARVSDSGLVGEYDSDRLHRVFAPRAVAADHLDVLTRPLGLQAFVLAGSAASVFLGAGAALHA
ncbi:KR domain-containing protein, partial [Frankia sp. AgKG'84/4]|nr:KR domain-containing protein [Frankia sp. AgKG'84/4]